MCCKTPKSRLHRLALVRSSTVTFLQNIVAGSTENDLRLRSPPQKCSGKKRTATGHAAAIVAAASCAYINTTALKSNETNHEKRKRLIEYCVKSQAEAAGVLRLKPLASYYQDLSARSRTYRLQSCRRRSFHRRSCRRRLCLQAKKNRIGIESDARNNRTTRKRVSKDIGHSQLKLLV
jgi:hypothetical protein